MAEAGFTWTALSASRERRAWLVAAAALCLLLTLFLALALWIEPSAGRALASGVAVAATLIAARAVASVPTPIELRIDADGLIWRRPIVADDDALPAADRLRPMAVGSRLCCLADARGRALAVWHDGLPVDCFRKLCAHARWHVERDRAGPADPANPANAANPIPT